MYKKNGFQGTKGQSSTRLLGIMRSLKSVLVLFLVMIMIEHSTSMLMFYRKLKPVEPLSDPLDYENKVRIEIILLKMYLTVITGNGS